MDFLGPLKTARETAVHIASGGQFLERVLYSEIFTHYGAPCSLVSNRSAQFMSKLVAALCELFAVKRHSTSPYHPQTNTSCERFNSYIGQALRAYVKDDHSDWPYVLPGILMAYRMTPAMRSMEFWQGNGYHCRHRVNSKSTLPRSFREHLTNIVDNLKLSEAVATENVECNIAKNSAVAQSTCSQRFVNQTAQGMVRSILHC